MTSHPRSDSTIHTPICVLLHKSHMVNVYLSPEGHLRSIISNRPDNCSHVHCNAMIILYL